MTSLVTDYLNTNNTEGYVEFFQLDTTSKGGPVYYLTPKQSSTGSIVYGGITYTSIPCTMSKSKLSTTGTLPQPQFSVSTVVSYIRAAINSLGSLAGCKITKFSTFEKYLDAVNTTRINLIDYSQDLAQATWTKSNTSVSSNVIAAPDGTMTADLILDNTTNAQHYISRVSGTLTFNTADRSNVSVYLKYAGIQYALVWMSSSSAAGVGGGVLVDLLNGTITGSNNPNFVSNQTISDVGNGWFKASFSCFANSTAATVRIYLSSTNSVNAPAYAGTGTSGVYAWGYQVERIPQVTTDAVNALAGGSTITQNTALVTDPVAGNTADIITDTTALSAHYAYWNQSGFKQGQQVTFTTHVRQGTFSKTQIRFFATTSTAYVSGGAITIDLTNGTIIGSASNLDSYSIQSLTNSWYRVSITITCTADGTLRPGIMILNAAGSTTYTGTGTDTLYFWNGQLSYDSYFKDYQMTTTTHAPYADPTAISPIETYIVSQMVDYNKNTATWKLTTPLDRPNIVIPRLQYLKDDIGESSTPPRCVYAPGLNRVME